MSEVIVVRIFIFDRVNEKVMDSMSEESWIVFRLRQQIYFMFCWPCILE